VDTPNYSQLIKILARRMNFGGALVLGCRMSIRDNDQAEARLSGGLALRMKRPKTEPQPSLTVGLLLGVSANTLQSSP